MQPEIPIPPGPSLEESLLAISRLRRQDVHSLQDWLSKQPHLPLMCDEELVPFLHRAGYSLERAKAAIDVFFTLRTHAPEMFARCDPDDPANQAALTFFHLAALPKLDAAGSPVLGLGFEPLDLSAFDAERAAGACAALMEVVVMRNPTPKPIVTVLDAANLRLAHITRAPLRLISTLLSFIQQAVPVPMKSIHVIHVHSVVEKTMMIIKPFLGRELQRLLHFHSGSMETFYEALPRDILPREYGGTCGSTADYHKEAVERLQQHKAWVMSLAERVVDESKRPAGSGGARPAFGAAGSFKALDID